jgi:hypothetical protein
MSDTEYSSDSDSSPRYDIDSETMRMRTSEAEQSTFAGDVATRILQQEGDGSNRLLMGIDKLTKARFLLSSKPSSIQSTRPIGTHEPVDLNVGDWVESVYKGKSDGRFFVYGEQGTVIESEVKPDTGEGYYFERRFPFKDVDYTSFRFNYLGNISVYSFFLF